MMEPVMTEEEAKQKVLAIPLDVKSAVSERIGLGKWKEMTWVERLEAINPSAQGSETSKKGGEAKQKTSQQPAKVEAGPAEVHYDEMIKHNKKNDCWMAFHGKVYDVTNFLDEHPGGGEIVSEQAGKDATQPFDDIGHSTKAKEMLLTSKNGIIFKGNLVGAPAKKIRESAEHSGGGGGGASGMSMSAIVIPMAVATAAFVAFFVMRGRRL